MIIFPNHPLSPAPFLLVRGFNKSENVQSMDSPKKRRHVAVSLPLDTHYNADDRKPLPKKHKFSLLI